jgi:hypothetical protein
MTIPHSGLDVTVACNLAKRVGVAARSSEYSQEGVAEAIEFEMLKPTPPNRGNVLFTNCQHTPL